MVLFYFFINNYVFIFNYCVNSDSHIQLVEVDDIPNVSYNFYHRQSHFHHVLCLLNWISLQSVCKAHDDIAISNSIHLVDFILQAAFIEFRKQISEHYHDLSRSHAAGVFGETCNIGVEQCDILEFVGKGQFVCDSDVFQFLEGL